MNGHTFLVETKPPFASIELLPTDHAYLLGRSSNCDIVVNHVSVSRRHAEISLVDSSVLVRDLRSRNGTFVDDKRLEQGALMIGQNIRFGSVSFVLALSDAKGELFDSNNETPSAASNEKSAIRSVVTDFAAGRLSAAQLRVFQLLLDGLMEKTIAKRLALSPHTVHNHIRAIYTVFGVHSRSELLAAELHTRHALK